MVVCKLFKLYQMIMKWRNHPWAKAGDRYAGNKQFQTLCLDHLLQVTCRHVSKQTERRSEVANLVSCGPTLYINVYLYIPSYPTIFPWYSYEIPFFLGGDSHYKSHPIIWDIPTINPIIVHYINMGMDQYLLIAFLGGWTSIYQLFWCSPGVQGFDTLPYESFLATESDGLCSGFWPAK